MSELKVISSIPAATPDAQSKSGKPEAPEAESAREAQAAKPPEPRLLNKTKVKTEPRTNFSFTYTFIDTETQRIIGQWPAPSPIHGYTKAAQA